MNAGRSFMSSRSLGNTLSRGGAGGPNARWMAVRSCSGEDGIGSSSLAFWAWALPAIVTAAAALRTAATAGCCCMKRMISPASFFSVPAPLVVVETHHANFAGADALHQRAGHFD